MTRRFTTYLTRDVNIAPLILLRVLFGFMMAVSVARFVLNGWVYDLYLKPRFYFSYYGFEWIKPLGSAGMYLLFAIMFLSAIGIMLGYRYRLSAILFFVSFTYVELIDKTNYLNHYYFVSLVSFLFTLVPAGRYFSLDASQGKTKTSPVTPAWTIDVFKLQLAIVYIFAGIAKLNSEWLFDAMPLRIWLPANNHLPLIGGLLGETWVAYFFSWAGAFYDLFIVFFLLSSATRIWAYGAVIIFHLLTWWLFPIGMFPFIMILSTLIFFPPAFHEKVLRFLKRQVTFLLPSKSVTTFTSGRAANESGEPSDYADIPYSNRTTIQTGICYFLLFFFLLQVLMPLRYLAYPGNLFWTEQGYRFSWRVMLMEKAGNVVFHVKDLDTGRGGDVMPSDYLTPVQEKMMSTQPDMILQFAHFLEEKLKAQGINNPEIRAEVYVTLNGRGTKKYIDDSIDLTTVKESFRHKDWILSFNPDAKK